jgi:hypothetical protein
MKKVVSLWRTYLAALGGVLLVVLFGVLGLQKTMKNLHTEQPQADQTVGELIAPAKVGQTFVAQHAGLSRVEVRLATYGRRNTGSLVFHLRSTTDTSADIITRTLAAEAVENNTYQAFEFPPVRDSEQRSFYFYLEAPQAEPGDAITVWGVKKDAYPEGEAVLEGLEDRKVRDLTFRLRYEPPLREKSTIFLEQLTSNKPSLWGDRRLYGLLGAVYLGLLYILFVHTMAETSDRS